MEAMIQATQDSGDSDDGADKSDDGGEEVDSSDEESEDSSEENRIYLKQTWIR